MFYGAQVVITKSLRYLRLPQYHPQSGVRTTLEQSAQRLTDVLVGRS